MSEATNELKNELKQLQRKLEIEIDGRAGIEEMRKLRNEIQVIKDEIDKIASKLK